MNMVNWHRGDYTRDDLVVPGSSSICARSWPQHGKDKMLFLQLPRQPLCGHQFHRSAQPAAGWLVARLRRPGRVHGGVPRRAAQGAHDCAVLDRSPGAGVCEPHAGAGVDSLGHLWQRRGPHALHARLLRDGQQPSGERCLLPRLEVRRQDEARIVPDPTRGRSGLLALTHQP